METPGKAAFPQSNISNMSAGVVVGNRGAFLNDNEPDYNHATDKEYTKFRKLAQEAYSKRNELSQQSQNAYSRGDKEQANALSAQSRKQLDIAESYNAKAAEYVFIENNRDSDDNDIDLHGLYVKEAEYILKQRIISGIRKNQSTLDCIVGKGLHSANGVAKLKPAVQQLCQDAHLRCWIDKKNQGVLHIDIKSAQIPQSWYQINPNGVGAMDEQYYAQHPELRPPQNAQHPAYQQPAHPQYQQPQYQQSFPQQQQHQQQHQNNGNNETGLILCGIFTTLLRAFCR